MGLVPSPPGKVEAEAVLFGGRDLLKLSADERRKLRGGKMSMIFQEPMTSLNPVLTVGQQIVEAILAHTAMSPRAAQERARSRCSSWCGSPRRRSASTTIRTTCRAACASAS